VSTVKSAVPWLMGEIRPLSIHMFFSHQCNRISETLAISILTFVTHTGLSCPAWTLLVMSQEISGVYVVSQLREKLWPLAIVIKFQDLKQKRWPSVDFLAFIPGQDFPGRLWTSLEILAISGFSCYYL